MRRRDDEDAGPTFVHYQVFAFGSDEELIGSFGSLARAAEEWKRVREAFMERWNLWGMPQAWWRFEPGIPGELRGGPPLVFSDADADAIRDLELARRRYLVGRGIDPAPPGDRPFPDR